MWDRAGASIAKVRRRRRGPAPLCGSPLLVGSCNAFSGEPRGDAAASSGFSRAGEGMGRPKGGFASVSKPPDWNKCTVALALSRALRATSCSLSLVATLTVLAFFFPADPFRPPPPCLAAVFAWRGGVLARAGVSRNLKLNKVENRETPASGVVSLAVWVGFGRMVGTQVKNEKSLTGKMKMIYWGGVGGGE